MDPLPHFYDATASAMPTGDVTLDSTDAVPFASASPREFGGPGGHWSPETLLVGAVADCFILTFRAMAKGSGLDWSAISTQVIGTLDRVDRGLEFTEFRLRVHLTIGATEDRARAQRLLEKAEHGCLISRSLRAGVRLDAEIAVAMAQPRELEGATHG